MYYVYTERVPSSTIHHVWEFSCYLNSPRKTQSVIESHSERHDHDDDDKTFMGQYITLLRGMKSLKGSVWVLASLRCAVKARVPAIRESLGWHQMDHGAPDTQDTLFFAPVRLFPCESNAGMLHAPGLARQAWILSAHVLHLGVIVRDCARLHPYQFAQSCRQ